MAKQLNKIDLVFNADTSKAKSQIQDLQNALSKISLAGFNENSAHLTRELNEASQAAAKLQVNLKDAINVDTGKLDLSKFAESMNRSGMSLEKYRKTLSAMGPEGEQAFVKLAQSITTAEIPLRRSNKLLTEFKNTLMNTARWQLSSSMLHGFMGAISQAMGYAQDLNKSLNNIRIVTGFNTDQMAEFAIQANKAAQALSTRTTDYTDAALIYYQQGIRDQKEIADRTDATIKLANVSRQSAEDVSSQMTAIWNNFYDGSKSLEYYADVITALGATTASSSEEIAGGMQKFAAVAETVGLSYEYAASALATIVATTRQSEDTVGTGLRTIFSRLEGLKLGNTLEDGTDLNKYSAALRTVGVEILDASGNLKDMDTILDETAARWDQLDKAQQVAFATTVGGVRQYTNLIALLDNWDQMQQNILTAKDSEGTLQKQQDIYAESWEAASKRVKAAMESIYNALLDDDFFIELTNGFATVLEGIDNFIDKIGGLRGVLVALSAVVMTVFQKEIAKSMSDLAYSVSMTTGIGRKKMIDMQGQANKEMVSTFSSQKTSGGEAKVQAYTALQAEQDAYIRNQDRMTESERNVNKIIMERNQLLAKEVAMAADEADQAKHNLNTQKRILETRLNYGKNADPNNEEIKTIKTNLGYIKEQQESLIQLQDTFGKLDSKFGAALSAGDLESFNKTAKDISFSTQEINILSESLQYLSGDIQLSAEEAEAFMSRLKNGSSTAEDLQLLTIALSDLSQEIDDANDELNTHQTELIEGAKIAEESGEIEKGTANAIEKVVEASNENAQAQADLRVKTEESTRAAKEHTRQMNEGAKASVNLSAGITQAAGALMSAAMIVTQITGLIKTLNDENATTQDKIIAVVTTMGMVAPMIVSNIIPAITGLKTEVLAFGETTALTMGHIYLILIAIAAIIAVVVKAFKDAEAASPEGVYKSAKKAAEDAEEAAKKVKNAYDELNNSLKSLDDGIESINNLERGTLEWRNAINESNAALIELLDSYNMLSNKNFTVDEDGLMHLTDAAREEMINQASYATNAAQSYVNSMKVAEYQAENNKNIIGTVKGGVKSYISNNGLIVDEGRAEHAPQWTDMSDDIALAVGDALVNAVNSNSLGDADKDSILNALSGIENLSQTSKESIADQIASNGELLSGLIELATSVQANTEAMNILTTQSFSTDTKKAIGESGLNQTGQAALEKIFANLVNDKKSSVYNDKYKERDGFWGALNNNDADMRKEYAKKMGYSIDRIEQVNGNQARYYTADGKEVGTFDDEKIRQYLAQLETESQLINEGVLNNYQQLIENLQSHGNLIGKGVGEALVSSIGGFGANLEALTNEQLNILESRVLDSSIAGVALSEEQVKAAGYESVQAYIQSIRAAIDDAQFDFNSITAGMNATVKEALRKIFPTDADLNKLTENEASQIANGYNKLFKAGGTDAVNAFNDFINQFGEDKEKLVKILTSSDIDFKDFNIGKQISEKLKELKIDIPKNFDVFIEKMRQLNNAEYPSVEETIGGMQAIQKEIAKLEFGKDIDLEIYDQLTEDQKKFFDYTSDGLLVLNTDAQTFYETVKQYNLETMFSELSRVSSGQTNLIGSVQNGISYRQNLLVSNNTAFEDYMKSENVDSLYSYANDNQNETNDSFSSNAFLKYAAMLDQLDPSKLTGDISDYYSMVSNQIKYFNKETDNSVMGSQVYGTQGSMINLNQNAAKMLEDIRKAFIDTIDEYRNIDEQSKIETQEELQKIVDYMLSMANSTSEANAIGEQIKASNQVDESIVDTAVNNRSHFLNIQDVADSADLSEAIAMAKEYGLAFADIQSVIMPLIQSEEDLALIREEYDKDLSNNIDLQILFNNKTLELADNLLKLKNAYDENITSQGQFLINSERIINTMISSASSLQELDNAMSDAFKFESDMQQIIPDFNLEGEYLQYSQKLIELGQNSKTATEETYHYSEALEDLSRKQEEFYSIQQQLNSWSVSDLSDEDIIKMADAQSGFAEARAKLMEAEDNLRATIRASEGASKYGFDAKEIENQAKQIRKFDQRLRDLDDSYEMSAEDATILAIANQRMNKGVATLNKNFKTWRNTLETTEKTSDDYAEAMTDVESAIADLIGAADDFDLPEGFLDAPENLDLIEKAAEGDARAINEIGLACAEAQVKLMQLDESFANVFDEPIDQSKFGEAQKAVVAGIQEIRANLDGLLDGSTTLGSVLDEGGKNWVEALNEMAKATGMSVDTMNGLLGELGVQAKVTVASVPQQMEVPTYDEYSMWINDTEPQTASYTTPNGETQTFEIPQYHRRTWSTPGPTISVEGYTQVAQISTEGGDGGSDIPEINYVGTGGTSTTSSGGSRGGGVSPSSTPAAKGSGGKGGSGSGGKKETKEKKNPTEEKERYHLINQQIERQTNLLDRLSKNKDRAFGPQKQQYYAKELKSLKDMGKMYEEHLRQSTDYLASDKAVMQQWGAIISDKDNSILNYDALVQAQVDAYNAAVDRYNNSAQEDADKEALEAAEKAYEQFLDDLKQYEDTVKQHEEDLNNYIDNIIQQYDTMKEKTAEAIEFRIEYDDDVLDFLDKLLDRLDSWNGSMYNAVDIMGKLNEQTGALVNKNKDLETGLHETLEHYLMDYKEYDKNGNLLFQTGLSYDQSNAFIDRFMNNQLTSDDIEFLSHLPAEEREAVKDLVGQLTDNADAIIENAQAVVDNVKKQFDDAKEEMDDASKPFERASEAFQNYADIIDIVGRDYLGVSDEIAKGLRQAEIDNAYFATVAAKAELESLAQQRDAVRDEMNKALADGNEELAEKYRDVLKEMDDEVQSATETFHEKWQEQLQSVYEQMTATFEDIKKKSLDALTGPEGSPWSALKDQADYAKTAAEEYLPEYEKIYELSKLNRDINKSIDDTDNVKNKKALRDLQKEINKLAEENKEVSQYEIDNARKKYELELARLELEEAKNVKDIVRLSKDSEGNWSYIYTADEADVADAEQNYEDKLYALQQANADYINSLQDEWLTFTEDYMDKRIEIESDMTLQEEERKERLDALANYYADHERYLTEQLETAVDNNKDLYDDDWRWYRDYTKAKANLDTENAVEMAENNIYRLGNEKEFVTDWNDTFLGTQTAFETFEEFQNNTTAVTEDFVNQMDQEVVNFEQNTQRAMESAGTSVDKFAEDMMDDVENTILPESEAAKDKIVEMGDAAVEVMDNLIDQADSWRDQYNDIMDAIIEKNELVIESINKVNGALSLLETENIGHDANEAGEGEAPESAVGSTGTGGSGDNGAGISPGGHEINEDSFRKIAAAIWVWNGAHAGWYTGADRRNRLIEKLGEAGANRVQQIINQEHDNLAFAYDWNALRNYFYSTFESGGYTGEWGSSGKLAMLHQKELVLNASDTENILGAVEMIRSISKSIDLNAMASQFAIGNLHAANANYGGNQLDQNVTITAEFPNATDRNEINEAFKMLINEASQYANRKNF